MAAQSLAGGALDPQSPETGGGDRRRRLALLDHQGPGPGSPARREREDGVWCALVLGRRLTRVRPRLHRPFQGWRYLESEDAPPDLVKGQHSDELPEKLASELRALGLL